MLLLNGEINVSKNSAKKVAQFMVNEGLYRKLENVSICDQSTIDIENEEYSTDIAGSLVNIADKCKEEGLVINGKISYEGDYEGTYFIKDNVVEDLSIGETYMREASTKTLIDELKRRGRKVTVTKDHLVIFL